MPSILKNYLAGLDGKFRLDKSNTFTNLIVEAKKNGIRIIPIDSSATYGLFYGSDHDSNFKRFLMMNYVAAQQIKKFVDESPKDKYLVFCGGAHTRQIFSGAPGIAEITGLPTLIVEDVTNDNISAENHRYRPDVLIRMSTTTSTAQISFSHEESKTEASETSKPIPPANPHPKFKI